MSRPCRILPIGGLAITAAAVLLTASSAGAFQSGPVDAARGHIEAGRYAEGLTAARQAERDKPNDYTARYYVALALYGLGQHDQAEAAARDALRLAPPSSQAEIQLLIDRVSSNRTSSGKVAEADAALAEGLSGKAARLYEEAFNANRREYEIGLKAAELYANRTQEPLKAAAILRWIQTSNASAEIIQKAFDLLERLKPALRQISDQELAAARAAPDWPTAKSRVALAIEADPSNPANQSTMLGLAMEANDLAAVETSAKALARANQLTVDLVLSQPGIRAVAARPEFMSLMTDTLGGPAAESIRQSAGADPAAYLTQLASQGRLALDTEQRNNQTTVARRIQRITAYRATGPCKGDFTFENRMMYASGSARAITEAGWDWASSDVRKSFFTVWSPANLPAGSGPKGRYIRIQGYTAGVKFYANLILLEVDAGPPYVPNLATEAVGALLARCVPPARAR